MEKYYADNIYEQIMGYDFTKILPSPINSFYEFEYDLITRKKYNHEQKLMQNLLKYKIIDFKFGKFGEYFFNYDSWYHQYGPGPYDGRITYTKKGYYVYALYLSMDGKIYISYQISNPHEGKGHKTDLMNWKFELFERPFLKFKNNPEWSYSGDMDKSWFDHYFVKQHIISELDITESKIKINKENSQYLKQIFHGFIDPEEILKLKYNTESFKNNGQIKKLEHGWYVKNDIINIFEAYNNIFKSNMYKMRSSIIELEQKEITAINNMFINGMSKKIVNRRTVKKLGKKVSKKCFDDNDNDNDIYYK